MVQRCDPRMAYRGDGNDVRCGPGAGHNAVFDVEFNVGHNFWFCMYFG